MVDGYRESEASWLEVIDAGCSTWRVRDGCPKIFHEIEDSLKEVLADGWSPASWLEVIEVESQGLTIPPKLAIGDGWGSGRHLPRNGPKRLNSVAGCTRRPTC